MRAADVFTFSRPFLLEPVALGFAAFFAFDAHIFSMSRMFLVFMALVYAIFRLSGVRYPAPLALLK
jgi:hypothetical protein